MSSKSKNLRAFASSREIQKEKAQPALLPKLRFPEFRGKEGWKERPLKAASQMNPANDGLPESFIYIDLESVEAGKLKAKNRISREGAPSRAQRLVDHGDIIFQVVRPYQRNNLLCEFQDEDYYVASTGYAQLRAKCSNHFLYQSIHTDSFVGRVMAKCTGSNYPAINSSDLADIHLPLPPLPEQQKIASCLSSVDELIAAQARKLDALKTHKKGLMQQLFPREGETQPRLRFPEFQKDGEWEKSPLSKFILSLDAGVSVNSGDSRPANKSEFGVLKTSAITKGHFDQEENKVVWAVNELCRLREPVTGGTIIICRKNTPALVGANAYVETSHENLFLPDLLWAAKPREGVSMRFLAFILCSVKGRAALTKLAKGSSASMSNITKPEVLAFSVMAPSPAEQQRIADCLTSLDNFIAAQTQKLVALKTRKKGLMQQLFPSLEE